MLQYIGWIGLVLLVFSFGLLITKYSKYFIISDLIATIFLLAHSIIIKDIPFVLVHSFISIALIIKQTKGGIK
jgi:hypothetical protein